MALYSETFNFNFKVLRYIGLWTLKTNNNLAKQCYFLYQTFSLFIITSFVVLQYIDLYSIRNDIREFNFNLCATASATIYLFKTFRILKKLPLITRLREDLNCDAENETDENCKKVFNKAASEMNSLNKLFYIMLYTLFFSWAFGPLVDFKSSEKKLPIRQWFPFDVKISPYYEYAHFYQITSGFFVITKIVTIDLVTFGFMMSLSAEYDVLNEKIKNFILFYGNSERDHASFQDKNGTALIKNFIDNHQKIIS